MSRRPDGLLPFAILACAITWLASLPLAWSFAHRTEPSLPMLLGGALAAFGPTLAAVAVAAPRGELRQVFGRWRARPRAVVGALLAPMAVHLVAGAVARLVGDHPGQWLYPPTTAEHVAAMVLFSVGEELGWRGFAHPRVLARWGPVGGSLLLGLLWALWHATMVVSPETGRVDPLQVGLLLTTLPAWSVITAWFLERNGRSLLVAIALHAGAHLDNPLRAEGEVGLHLAHVVVVWVAAALAARSLVLDARREPGTTERPPGARAAGAGGGEERSDGNP